MWSRKLHDFLQPKRHILMEPEPKYHEYFIKPLLELPDSKYRHSNLAGAGLTSYISNYSKVLNDKSLVEEPITPLAKGDPQLRRLKPDILLTGNLARASTGHSQLRSTYVDYQALVIQHMMYAALSNEMIHRQGLVRMLWWIPEGYLEDFFTFTLKNRRSFAVSVGMGADVDCAVSHSSVREIETRRNTRMYRSRLPGLDMRRGKGIDFRMERAGLSVPEGREVVPFHDPGDTTDILYQSPLEIKYSTVEELEAALAAEEERCEHIDRRTSMRSLLARNQKKRSLPTLNELLDSMRFPEAFAASKPAADNKLLNHPRMALAVDANLSTIRLEANFRQLEENSTLGADFAPQLRQRLLTQIHRAEKLATANMTHTRFLEICHDICEDFVAFFTPPPPLLRDRRSYATLQAAPTDFWPQRPLALLDFHPGSRDLSVPGLADSTEAAKVLQEFVKIIFISRASPLPDSLNRLAPNAAKELIPAVPAVTDARKGGRMVPALVTTRMLTDEMLEGLLKAFMEWPFRPATWELALAVSETAGEGGGVEEEVKEGEEGGEGSE